MELRQLLVIILDCINLQTFMIDPLVGTANDGDYYALLASELIMFLRKERNYNSFIATK